MSITLFADNGAVHPQIGQIGGYQKDYALM